MKAVCLNTAMTLTDKDLKALSDLIRVTIEEIKLVTKDDIKHLPTKDELYEKLDKVMGELKAIRDEHKILSNQVSQDFDALEKLKKIHPHFQHTSL